MTIGDAGYGLAPCGLVQSGLVWCGAVGHFIHDALTYLSAKFKRKPSCIGVNMLILKYERIVMV
jgi:sulfite exporter TauE/SafE